MHRHRLAMSAAACLWLLVGTASAQTILAVRPPTRTFEGQSGTTTLTFTIESQSGALPAPVTGTVSTFTGGLLSPATGGAACGGGVDFQPLSRSITIPAGTTAPTPVAVTVCGDVTVEGSERVALSLTNVVNGSCGEACAAIGVITNDDGPPSVTIADLSTSEPFTGTKGASVIVSLSHPSSSSTSVRFATRNGTASNGSSLTALADYRSTSGTLSIPAGTLTGPVPVTILSDTLKESDETFFVDLSSPSPTGVTISDASAVVTIRDAILTSVGTFDVGLEAEHTRVGTPQVFQAAWELPEPLVWRDLRTLDFRVRGPQSTVLWVRWDEPSDTFSLCGVDDTWGRSVVDVSACGEGRRPGTPGVLASAFASLDLAGTRVKGSGPTGRVVTLTLPITFGQACGDCLVELAATADSGAFDDFAPAGRLKVLGQGAPRD